MGKKYILENNFVILKAVGSGDPFWKRVHCNRGFLEKGCLLSVKRALVTKKNTFKRVVYLTGRLFIEGGC